MSCPCEHGDCDACRSGIDAWREAHKPQRGLLDTWRSEAFRQGFEYAKNKAAETVYAMLRTQDARLIEQAIMRLQPPRDDE